VRCLFSNYSTDYVELSAPGCDDSVPSQVGYSYGQYGVLSTVRKTEDPMYKYMPGTSMATPHIAGAAAVVIGYMKSKTGIWPTPAQVEEILKNGSRKALNLSTYVTDGRTLDLESLFQYMDSLLGPGC
jgi:subtilisin family serine protease